MIVWNGVDIQLECVLPRFLAVQNIYMAIFGLSKTSKYPTLKNIPEKKFFFSNTTESLPLFINNKFLLK